MHLDLSWCTQITCISTLSQYQPQLLFLNLSTPRPMKTASVALRFRSGMALPHHDPPQCTE
jgi:hypothetical protein